MPTDAAQLATIKTQTLAIIASLTENPKPNYNIDGQNISWGTYLAQLQKTIAWCDEQIAANTPYEVHSQGFT